MLVIFRHPAVLLRAGKTVASGGCGVLSITVLGGVRGGGESGVVVGTVVGDVVDGVFGGAEASGGGFVFSVLALGLRVSQALNAMHVKITLSDIFIIFLYPVDSSLTGNLISLIKPNYNC